MMRLLVLQHIEREGPQLFEEVAQSYGMEVNIIRLDNGDPLPIPDSQDLILIMGGPMGIKEVNNPNYVWLKSEVEFIKNALKSEFKIIGVCLGAQLLAHSAGGGVEPLLKTNSRKKLPEIGWGSLELQAQNKDKDFEKFFQSSFNVLHWHGDRILLPKMANLIASSRRCKEQFFSIGKFAYGLQFHIEVDEIIFSQWIAEDYEFIKLALGKNAKQILFDQQRKYSSTSLDKRLAFIREIFSKLGFTPRKISTS